MSRGDVMFVSPPGNMKTEHLKYLRKKRDRKFLWYLSITTGFSWAGFIMGSLVPREWLSGMFALFIFCGFVVSMVMVMATGVLMQYAYPLEELIRAFREG